MLILNVVSRAMKFLDFRNTAIMPFSTTSSSIGKQDTLPNKYNNRSFGKDF